MKLVRKDIAVRLVGANEESRTMWVVASTEDVDRDGDRILSTAWRLENFMKNPVIPWAHKYDQPPVARALITKIENGSLKLLAQFAKPEEYSFADTIYRLYKGKFLNAFSVGFDPIGSEQVERTVNGRRVRGRDYHEVELWEVSACTVPSNPNALVVAAQKGIISQCESQMLSEYQNLHALAEEAAGRIIGKRIEEIVKRRIDVYLIDQQLKDRGLF